MAHLKKVYCLDIDYRSRNPLLFHPTKVFCYIAHGQSQDPEKKRPEGTESLGGCHRGQLTAESSECDLFLEGFGDF